MSKLHDRKRARSNSYVDEVIVLTALKDTLYYNQCRLSEIFSRTSHREYRQLRKLAVCFVASKML